MKMEQSFKTASRKAMLLAGVALVTISCAVSPEHHVRNGADPRYQDENVAFQTVQYLRVFNPCSGQIEGDIKIPEYSSLFRFKMTGKASTTTNNIKFESGTLRDTQIDPFGAKVQYDEKSKQFRFVSASEAEAAFKKSRAWEEYDELVGRYETVKNQIPDAQESEDTGIIRIFSVDSTEAATPDTTVLDQLKKAMEAKLQEAIATEMVPSSSGLSGEGDGTIDCSINPTKQRGFQILGPEGWRTFDQGERLIMAMHTSSRPLTDILQELSKRVLNSYNSSTHDTKPLLEAQLRASEAKRELDVTQAGLQASDSPSDSDLCGLTRSLMQSLNGPSDGEDALTCEEGVN